MTEIRREQPGDIEAVRRVNDLAFEGPNEGAVIDRLRESCDEFLSLVALVDGRVVGHILFSPVELEAEDGRTVRGMGLAPLAVLPEYQRQGIGTELANAGLAIVRQTPCPFVIVLGHVEYYPRFGIARASARGIRCQWDVPDEAFMALELSPGTLTGIRGVVRYRPEFTGV